ncbi:MAG: YIP1 family protein [Anaerolineae bacterium]|nr:YIP1 family protein [Anaerolineae bacterium]
MPAGKEVPWYKIWLKVYLQPSEESYQELLSRCDTRMRRPLVWMATSTGIAAAFPLFLFVLTNGRVVHPDLERVLRAGAWALYVLGGVLAVALSPLIFWGIVRALDGLAREMGGSGSTEHLAFLVGAAYAPLIVVSTLIEGVLGLFMSLVLELALAFFIAFLITIGIRTVYRLSWWRSAAVVLICGALLFGALLLVLCSLAWVIARR